MEFREREVIKKEEKNVSEKKVKKSPNVEAVTRRCQANYFVQVRLTVMKIESLQISSGQSGGKCGGKIQKIFCEKKMRLVWLTLLATRILRTGKCPQV